MLIPDSGGAGRYRGGLGIERIVRARTDVVFNTQIDRVYCAARDSYGVVIEKETGEVDQAGTDKLRN